MPTPELPIGITYETLGTTPIRDVIAALEATDALVQDAVSLLPSVLSATDVRLVSISVKRLTQESPLKEIIIAAVFVTAQKQLEDGIVAVTKDVTGIEVPPEYHTILTVAVLVVLFYGVSLAKDVLAGILSEGPAKRKLTELVADLARKTGRSPEEVSRILDAKYAKPSLVQVLVRNALAFFVPSKRQGEAGLQVGEYRIEPQIVNDVPFTNELRADQDFERFKPYENVTLKLHAQDIDKAKTGWAAIPNGITDRRLKLKLMPPVQPADLWGKSIVRGDIVVISKSTSAGFEPSEIHLTSIIAAE